MNGPRRKCFENGVDRAIKRLPPTRSKRIKIALNRTPRLDFVAGKTKLDHPVQSDRIDRDVIEIAPQLGPGAARKADDLAPGIRSRTAATMRARRLNAPLSELVSRQYSRPGIENLHGIDAGLELPDQIARSRLRPACRSSSANASGCR